MSLVHLEIDASQLQRVIADVGAIEPEARAALKSTLPKMAAWIRGKSVPGLAQATNVPQRVVRRRLKTFRITASPDSSSITVWYGLDPVGMIYLQARQTRAGVKAYGGRAIKSAFIADGRNGGRQVFKRRSKSRLPLDKQTAEIVRDAESYIEDRLFESEEFTSRFFVVFERELLWRMQKQR